MTKRRIIKHEISPDPKIGEVPPETASAALAPLLDLLKKPSKMTVGELSSQTNPSDDLPKLMRKFEGGVKLSPPDEKTPYSTVIDSAVEASIERKLARIRSEPNTAQMIPHELYERLTDESFISPRVGKAVESIMRLGFTDKPLKAGIQFIRKTHDIDGPVSDDVGCILLFHFPVDSAGKPIRGLVEGEKPGRRVCAVSVEFDGEGNINSIKRHDVPRGDKFRTPVNAYVSVVPPAGDNDKDYYYRKVVLTDVGLDKQQARANGKTIEQAQEECAESIKGCGRLVGVSRTVDGKDLRTYELRASGLSKRFAVLRSKEHVVEGVYAVEEKPCPQTEIGGVRVGVFVEPSTCGMPLKKRLGDVIKETAVKEHFWNGHNEDLGYDDRKRLTREAVTDLASAVAPLQLEEEAEREEDIIRFMERNAPVIPFLIGLKRQVGRMPAAEKGKLPEELLTASYSQLFAAAIFMQGKGRVLNHTYCLENLDNFLEVMGELEPDDRKRMFGRTELLISPEADRIIQRIDVMEAGLRSQMSEEHAQLRDSIAGHVDSVVGAAKLELRDAMQSDIERINERVGLLSTEQQAQILESFTEGLGELKDAWPEQAKLIGETLKKGKNAPNTQGSLRLTVPIIPFLLSAYVQGNVPNVVGTTAKKIGGAFKKMLEAMKDFDPKTLALYDDYMPFLV